MAQKTTNNAPAPYATTPPNSGYPCEHHTDDRYGKPILCGLCALRELAVAKEVIADLKQRLTVATEEAKADIRGRLTDAIDRVLH